jgi:hypothetical protein
VAAVPEIGNQRSRRPVEVTFSGVVIEIDAGTMGDDGIAAMEIPVQHP